MKYTLRHSSHVNWRTAGSIIPRFLAVRLTFAQLICSWKTLVPLLIVRLQLYRLQAEVFQLEISIWNAVKVSFKESLFVYARCLCD